MIKSDFLAECIYRGTECSSFPNLAAVEASCFPLNFGYSEPQVRLKQQVCMLRVNADHSFVTNLITA
jgi:hypothetical protein